MFAQAGDMMYGEYVLMLIILFSALFISDTGNTARRCSRTNDDDERFNGLCEYEQNS